MTFSNNVQAEKASILVANGNLDDTVANINPSDISENIGDFAQASQSQVEQAIQAAKAAQPQWEQTPIERRRHCKQLAMN